MLRVELCMLFCLHVKLYVSTHYSVKINFKQVLYGWKERWLDGWATP